MKDGIHPKYQSIVFKDASSGFTFLTRSTIKPGTHMIKWEDSKDYQLITVDVSSASHPFYTGKTKFVDATGPVDRFNKKFQGTYGKGAPKKEKDAKEAKS